ncbi:hypothetical protein IAT38_001858 [Cryptococcus sp. DSM 104549]
MSSDSNTTDPKTSQVQGLDSNPEDLRTPQMTATSFTPHSGHGGVSYSGKVRIANSETPISSMRPATREDLERAIFEGGRPLVFSSGTMLPSASSPNPPSPDRPLVSPSGTMLPSASSSDPPSAPLVPDATAPTHAPKVSGFTSSSSPLTSPAPTSPSVGDKRRATSSPSPPARRAVGSSTSGDRVTGSSASVSDRARLIKRNHCARVETVPESLFDGLLAYHPRPARWAQYRATGTRNPLEAEMRLLQQESLKVSLGPSVFLCTCVDDLQVAMEDEGVATPSAVVALLAEQENVDMRMPVSGAVQGLLWAEVALHYFFGEVLTGIVRTTMSYPPFADPDGRVVDIFPESSFGQERVDLFTGILELDPRNALFSRMLAGVELKTGGVITLKEMEELVEELERRSAAGGRACSIGVDLDGKLVCDGCSKSIAKCLVQVCPS